MTYLFYTWKFVPIDPLQPFCLSPPLASGNNQSVSVSKGSLLFCFFFFFLDFIYSEILKLITWTTALSNQSVLKEMSPECSLEELMMKLKLQYFGYLMQRTGSLGKTLILGKIEGRRRRGQHRMLGFQNKWKPICSSWQMKNIGPRTWWTWVWASSRSPRGTGKPGVLIKGKRRRGRQRTRCLDRITVSMDINLSKRWEKVKDR